MIQMTREKHLAAPSAVAVFLSVAGCTVGPKYQRASAPVPAKWDVSEPWRESAPRDQVAKGEWWSVFQNDELSALAKEALDANQTIKVTIARVEKAREAAALQVATEFPTLSTAPIAERQRLSGNRPRSSNVPVTSPVSQNNFILPFVAGYEADLFGQRRRSIEASQASYQASAADLENNATRVAVKMFTLEGDEQVAGIEGAGINGIPCRDQVLVELAFGGGKFGDAPQR